MTIFGFNFLKRLEWTTHTHFRTFLKSSNRCCPYQADAERGFSDSGLILTDDKTHLGVRTLNARLNIKSTLKLYYNNNHNLVNIEKDFIKSARQAHKNYMIYLEEVKKKEEELKKKQEEATRKKIDDAAAIENICKKKNQLKSSKIRSKKKKRRITSMLNDCWKKRTNG